MENTPNIHSLNVSDITIILWCRVAQKTEQDTVQASSSGFPFRFFFFFTLTSECCCSRLLCSPLLCLWAEPVQSSCSLASQLCFLFFFFLSVLPWLSSPSTTFFFFFCFSKPGISVEGVEIVGGSADGGKRSFNETAASFNLVSISLSLSLHRAEKSGLTWKCTKAYSYLQKWQWQ